MLIKEAVLLKTFFVASCDNKWKKFIIISRHKHSPFHPKIRPYKRKGLHEQEYLWVRKRKRKRKKGIKMLYCLFVISHRKAHYSRFHEMDVKRKL